jgi:hypothetical protein
MAEAKDEAKEPLKIKVNGKEYPWATEFDLGEMCDAERFFGVEFGENGTSGIRSATATLWISIRRMDPTVTVEDVRALPPEIFDAFLEAEVKDESPPPADAGSGVSDKTGEPSPPGGDGQDRSLRAIGGPGSETVAESPSKASVG